jgi:hypothetical protein
MYNNCVFWQWSFGTFLSFVLSLKFELETFSIYLLRSFSSALIDFSHCLGLDLLMPLKYVVRKGLHYQVRHH